MFKITSRYTKEIAGKLEAAAQSAEQKDEVRATEKQVWFLADLISKDTSFREGFNPKLLWPPLTRLTKKRASQMIGAYISK